MYIRGHGEGTGDPWITVHAGPQGAHPMIFHVSQVVWDYVMTHGVDLEYNRRVMQRRLDAIQARHDGFPVRAAGPAANEATPAPRKTLTPLGWGLAGAAVLGAAAYRARR